MICFLSLIAFDSGLVAEKLDSELFTLERKAPATATGSFQYSFFNRFLSRYKL